MNFINLAATPFTVEPRQTSICLTPHAVVDSEALDLSPLAHSLLKAHRLEIGCTTTMLTRKATRFLIGCAAFLAAHASHATLYNLGDFGFGFSGDATRLSAVLETSALGEFSDEAQIEALLNTAAYSVQLYGGETLLASMDSSNASWDLRYSNENGPRTISTLLTVSPTEMTLSLFTPTELTEAQLLLMRSWDVGAPFNLQYVQFNNVTNGNFVDLDYNAIHHAFFHAGYGATFVFPAITRPTSVPEPATLGLMLCMLGLSAVFTNRRRSRSA